MLLCVLSYFVTIPALWRLLRRFIHDFVYWPRPPNRHFSEFLRCRLYIPPLRLIFFGDLFAPWRTVGTWEELFVGWHTQVGWDSVGP